MADDSDSTVRLTDLVQMTPEQIRALADVSGATPDLGRMTPRPSMDHLDRQQITNYSLADVVQILHRAKTTGDTSRMVDLWLHMLQSDDHLPSVWETRIAPVAGADWELYPAANSDEKVAQLCTEALEHIESIDRVFLSQLNAIGLGYDAGEIIWGRGKIGGIPAWVPREIQPVHARRLRFSSSYELGLYDQRGMSQSLESKGWQVETLPSRSGRLLRLPAGKYVVHLPRTIADYPTGTGIVHSIARWWWIKVAVTKYWLGGAEFAGNARLIGKLPDNAPQDVREEMRQGLEDLAALGVIVLRGESEVEIVSGQAQASGEVWDKLAKRMDAAMSKRVIGSTLNVEIGDTGGNRAAAESQDDVTIDPRQKMDGDQLWADWRRDVVSPIIQYNPHIFQPGTPVPYGRFITESQDEEVDAEAIATGWVRVDEFRRSRKLPEIGGETGQQFIKPQQAAPARFSDESPLPLGGLPVPLSRKSSKTRSPSRSTASPWQDAMRVATETFSHSTSKTGKKP